MLRVSLALTGRLDKKATQIWVKSTEIGQFFAPKRLEDSIFQIPPVRPEIGRFSHPVRRFVQSMPTVVQSA
jgi:hypothetical protein